LLVRFISLKRKSNKQQGLLIFFAKSIIHLTQGKLAGLSPDSFIGKERHAFNLTDVGKGGRTKYPN